jgi:hypothetical protein
MLAQTLVLAATSITPPPVRLALEEVAHPVNTPANSTAVASASRRCSRAGGGTGIGSPGDVMVEAQRPSFGAGQ